MENLAFVPRFAKRTWLPGILALSGLASYACGGSDEMVDADGLGGGSGGGIIVMPPTGGDGGMGTGGTNPDAKPPFETCSLQGQGTTPSGSLMVDDFDDGDAVLVGNGLHGTWYQFDDDTGGTQTPSWNEPQGWLPELGGIDGEGHALHVEGGGFTYWGSGEGMAFIWDESKDQECLFDAGDFDGVTFWLKGEIDGSDSSADERDRGVLKLGFQEADILPVEVGGRCTGANGGCYDWHKVRITPTACWHKYSFLFEDFEQDGWGMDGEELNLDELLNFNLEIAHGNSYDYWLDEVELFSGDRPEAEDICDEGMGGGGGEGGGGP